MERLLIVPVASPLTALRGSSLVSLQLQEGPGFGVPLHFPAQQSRQKDEVCTLHWRLPGGLAAPASSSVPAPDSLPQLCSPALAGVQIPSSLLSLGLGKQSGFLRFLTSLLPEHKDKELFISPLPSVFLRSAELQMPLGITVISRAYAHLLSLPPCPSHPSSTCVSQHNV